MSATLLCTVGASLFNNLHQLNDTIKSKPDNWQELKRFYEDENWHHLVKPLLQLVLDATGYFVEYAIQKLAIYYKSILPGLSAVNEIQPTNSSNLLIM